MDAKTIAGKTVFFAVMVIFIAGFSAVFGQENSLVGVVIVVMALILLAGHAINFGLCTISSLVHPLRLIFVEYYKNSEFEGGGKQYAPLKQHSNN